jgi:hypothetical protein
MNVDMFRALANKEYGPSRAWWLLGFGDQQEVLNPPHLREELEVVGFLQRQLPMTPSERYSEQLS